MLHVFLVEVRAMRASGGGKLAVSACYRGTVMMLRRGTLASSPARGSGKAKTLGALCSSWLCGLISIMRILTRPGWNYTMRGWRSKIGAGMQGNRI